MKTGQSAKELFDELVHKYDVPEEHQFNLLHKIRVAIGMGKNVEERRQLLMTRILSIAVMVNMFSEDVAQNKLFLFEPDLIQKLTDLIQPEKQSFFVNVHFLFSFFLGGVLLVEVLIDFPRIYVNNNISLNIFFLFPLTFFFEKGY